VQFADHDQPGACAALAAEIAAGTIAVVEPVSVPTAAYRAWPMFVGQEPGIDPELRQDLTPAATGALDGVHADLRDCDFAKAIWRLRTHDKTCGSGSTGGNDFQDQGGLVPANFS